MLIEACVPTFIHVLIHSFIIYRLASRVRVVQLIPACEPSTGCTVDIGLRVEYIFDMRDRPASRVEVTDIYRGLRADFVDVL